MAKTGIKVRGACPDGHTYEGTSAPGRVTWTGDCPTSGCGKPVTARRIKSNEPPPATPPANTEQPVTGLEIKQVQYAEQPPPSPPEEAEPGAESGDPAGEHEPDSVGGHPGVSIPRGSSPEPEPSELEQPDGLELAGGKRKRFGRGRPRPVPQGGTYAGIPY